MYLTSRHVDRNVRIFHTARGNPDSFHLIATDMSVMVDNPDALTLYMAILWDKYKEIRWKSKRFNDALNWLVEKGVMHSATAVRYERQDTEKTNGRVPSGSPSVRDELQV